MKNYGLPYQGSKNRIMSWLMEQLPAADTFVDLFAGGCSVSHAAMLSGKYRHVIANDITDSAFVFRDAIRGRWHNERRWISRDDFFRLKDKDPYVRICFSFGNDQRSYMYAKELEPYKKACHYAIVFDRWHDMDVLCPEVSCQIHDTLDSLSFSVPYSNNEISQRRIAFGNALLREVSKLDDEVVKKNPLYQQCHCIGGGYSSIANLSEPLRFGEVMADRKIVNTFNGGGIAPETENLVRFQRVQNLEHLESLTDLESCKSKVSFLALQSDYRSVTIPENALVYCDPPYRQTKKYLNGFDYDSFYSWCQSKDYPVYVSEYNMPEGFTAIADVVRSDSQCATKTVKRIEKLFVQSRFAKDCCRLLFLP